MPAGTGEKLFPAIVNGQARHKVAAQPDLGRAEAKQVHQGRPGHIEDTAPLDADANRRAEALIQVSAHAAQASRHDRPQPSGMTRQSGRPSLATCRMLALRRAAHSCKRCARRRTVAGQQANAGRRLSMQPSSPRMRKPFRAASSTCASTCRLFRVAACRAANAWFSKRPFSATCAACANVDCPTRTHWMLTAANTSSSLQRTTDELMDLVRPHVIKPGHAVILGFMAALGRRLIPGPRGATCNRRNARNARRTPGSASHRGRLAPSGAVHGFACRGTRMMPPSAPTKSRAVRATSSQPPSPVPTAATASVARWNPILVLCTFSPIPLAPPCADCKVSWTLNQGQHRASPQGVFKDGPNKLSGS